MVATTQAPTTLITSAEFGEMFGECDRVELWRGVVVETSPVNPTHHKVSVCLATILNSHALMQVGIGEFWPPDAGLTIQQGPDTVVSPDLSFVPADVSRRLNDDEPGFPFVVPPLVVEVESPGDSEQEIAEKLALYLAAGVAEIWWVRPKAKTLTRYWVDRDPIVLRPGDVLADIDVLPGFSMMVDDMFPPEQTMGGDG